jgi:hypothetical protein
MMYNNIEVWLYHTASTVNMLPLRKSKWGMGDGAVATYAVNVCPSLEYCPGAPCTATEGPELDV